MRVLIVIPAYNEASNILNTVNAIRAFQDKTIPQLDFIVIDDGSTDETFQICRKNGIKVIRLVQNLGIGGGVQTGYKYGAMMGYDIVVQFDGDGQHDISSLPALIAPLIDGSADFVVGSRFLDKSSQFQSTFFRRIGIRFLSGVIRLCTGKKITDPTSGFRAAGKKACAYLAQDYPSDYPEPESAVALMKNGFCVKEVQVNMFERAGGKSSIQNFKSVYYIIKVSLAIICRSFQRGRKTS